MWKSLGYFILLGAAIFGAVWMADRPGQVRVEWLGWQADTSMPVLLAFVVIAAVVLTIIWRVWTWMRGAPKRYSEYRHENAQKKGYLALTQGFKAIAAGDSEAARKQLRIAENKLNDPETTLLLAAQTAELAGEDRSAKESYDEMLGNRDTELAALKGLLIQARSEGNTETALSLARRAVELKPKSGWAAKALLELSTKVENWPEAEKALSLAAKSGLYDTKGENKLKAVLLTAQALDFVETEKVGDALKVGKQATDLNGEFVPATIQYAKALHADGKTKKAISLIEDAWRETPHPELASLYLSFTPDDAAIAQAQKAEHLGGFFPDHPESLFVVAETALNAELWGRAREQLGRLTATSPTRRASRLMAQLEQGENKDLDKANDWLKKVPDSLPNPAWRCTSCGTESGEWLPLCPHCGDFNTLNWNAPSTDVVIAKSGWGYDTRKS